MDCSADKFPSCSESFETSSRRSFRSCIRSAYLGFIYVVTIRIKLINYDKPCLFDDYFDFVGQLEPRFLLTSPAVLVFEYLESKPVLLVFDFVS